MARRKSSTTFTLSQKQLVWGIVVAVIIAGVGYVAWRQEVPELLKGQATLPKQVSGQCNIKQVSGTFTDDILFGTGQDVIEDTAKRKAREDAVGKNYEKVSCGKGEVAAKNDLKCPADGCLNQNDIKCTPQKTRSAPGGKIGQTIDPCTITTTRERVGGKLIYIAKAECVYPCLCTRSCKQDPKQSRQCHTITKIFSVHVSGEGDGDSYESAYQKAVANLATNRYKYDRFPQDLFTKDGEKVRQEDLQCSPGCNQRGKIDCDIKPLAEDEQAKNCTSFEDASKRRLNEDDAKRYNVLPFLVGVSCLREVECQARCEVMEKPVEPKSDMPVFSSSP